MLSRIAYLCVIFQGNYIYNLILEFARTSGCVLLLGVGSYIAYKFCCKIFGHHFARNLWENGLIARDLCQPQLLNTPSFALEDSCSFLLADDELSNDMDCVSNMTDITGVPLTHPKTSPVHIQCSRHVTSAPNAISSSQSTPSRMIRKCKWNTKRCTLAERDSNHSPGGSDSSDSINSPPPIRRRGRLNTSTPMVGANPLGAFSSESGLDCGLWEEPLFTPCGLWEEPLFTPSSNPPIHPNMLTMSDPAALLASIYRNELGGGSEAGLSEYSELAQNTTLDWGVGVAADMDKLTGDVSQLKDDVLDLNIQLTGFLERSEGILTQDRMKQYYHSVALTNSEVNSACGDSRSETSSIHSNSIHRTNWTVSQRKGVVFARGVGRPMVPNKKAGSWPRDTPIGLGSDRGPPGLLLFKGDNAIEKLEDDHLKSNKGFNKGRLHLATSDSMVDSAISTDMNTSDSANSDYYKYKRSFTINEQPPLSASEQGNTYSVTSWGGSEFSLEWEDMGPPHELPPHPHNTNQCNKWMDLLVYAREKYVSNVNTVKVLTKLHGNGRLTRILQLDESTSSCVLAPLHAILATKTHIFKCSKFQIVAEVVDMSLRRCPFLKEWPQVAKFKKCETNDYFISCLSKLWNLHEISINGCYSEDVMQLLQDTDYVDLCLEGLKVLMILRALEVYEQSIYTKEPPLTFYSQLFIQWKPPVLMAQLEQFPRERTMSQLELALFADTLNIRLEVFDLVNSHPHIASVYPSSTQSTYTPITLIHPTPMGYLPLVKSNIYDQS